MNTLHLDYVRKPVRVPWLGWALLSVVLVAAAVMLLHFKTIEERAAAWEAKAGVLERVRGVRAGLARASDRAVVPHASEREVRQANAVVRQITLPWNDLFAAVESAGNVQIALLSLVPDVRTGTVKISGEARDLAALLDYVERLSGGPVFESVFLESHRIQQGEAEKPLRFSLRAQWKDITP